MALKRNWVGRDSNISRPSILNATDGLSPFLVIDMTEDQVAEINEDDDALSRASYVTLQDIKTLKKQITPKIPQEGDQFMLLLKRYANLLFALFSELSPMFRAVVTIITALKSFSRQARETMSKRTKASILWIILLQKRQFAIGDTTILAQFSTMQANLAAKNELIVHVEVPSELIEPAHKKKRKHEGLTDNADEKEDDGGKHCEELSGGGYDGAGQGAEITGKKYNLMLWFFYSIVFFQITRA